MGFASAYLEGKALFPQKIVEAPDRETGIIVVVPAYNEPEIVRLLDSLSNCIVPDCKVEVIIVINAPDDATIDCLENNIKSITKLESWKRTNKNCFFRLFIINVAQYSVAGWGVGLARKAGMDEAIRRFDKINYPDGVIVNLDADCTVDKNYFVAICNELLRKKEVSACSVYFEHPLSGDSYQDIIYRNITLYELHLRYYFQGLAYSGFPYVFHTVGSAIAVKALPYIKAGGMNRRKAGEDFYFIQKLVPAGGYFNLISTTVYPSPRTSYRVPFGTGATMGKMSIDKSSAYWTYNIQSFKELRIFFDLINVFYKNDPFQSDLTFNLIPPGLGIFLDRQDFIDKMTEIKNNTSGLQSFKKRFFDWFNMFKVVKYMNFINAGFYKKTPVEIAASELLQLNGVDIISEDPAFLLNYYRSLERSLA